MRTIEEISPIYRHISRKLYRSNNEDLMKINDQYNVMPLRTIINFPSLMIRWCFCVVWVLIDELLIYKVVHYIIIKNNRLTTIIVVVYYPIY